ncbi:MAG: phosphoglucosamine mutase [Haloferacaceae archaeon]
MFGTSGVRGPVGETITADLAVALGRAVATAGADRVVVGRDGRETGAVLQSALAAGIRECGADVVDVGVAATPTVARSVGWRDADAGVVVTASHNPPADNGFKFWTPSGRAFGETRRAEIERIVDRAAYDRAPWDAFGSLTRWEGATGAHVDALCDRVEVDPDLSVVVDVGNGTGRVTADALTRLGASVETLNGQLDGRFPGRESEPTAESCRSLCRVVEATDADLGIAHDGDADRAMAVDETGAFVPGDVLLAVFALDALESGEEDADVVVTPVDASMAVEDAVRAAGGRVVRTRVGDVSVAERAADPDAAFGGEASGAWIWPAETLCPDGPLAACKLAELVGRGPSLADRRAAIDTYPIRRASVEVDDKGDRMRRVRERVRERYDEGDLTTLDGVRVDRGDGWFLVRASGTQPLVRLTAEAREEARAADLLVEARSLVEETDEGA